MLQVCRMIDILTPDFEFIDDRGKFTQLAHEGYKQINVIQTFAGKERGRFHYHKINYELFYVINGELLLKCTDKYYNFKTGDMFSISPNTEHSLEFIQDTLLVSMYSHGVELEDGSKDIIEI